MGSNSPEPLLTYEEVQLLIDERLNEILQQDSSEPGQGRTSAQKSDKGGVNSKLNDFWKKLTTKKQI